MLKENEALVYEFMVAYTKEHLYPPTIAEICAGTGYASKGTVYVILRTIEKKGAIEIADNSPRAIRLTGYRFMKGDE